MQNNGLDKYCEKALEMGFTHAKQIHPESVVTAPWVRLKCQFGCFLHGKGYGCPPHTPTPEETRSIIDCYKRAILFHIELPATPDRNNRYKENCDGLTVLEGELFKDGYYKAFVFLQGTCIVCTNPEKPYDGEHCSAVKGEPCRFGAKARPSMESCGIDVFQTARNNGFYIETLREQTETWNLYALMLVD